jgi:chromosome segregation ATPase
MQSTTEMDAAREQLDGKARAASEASAALTSARTEAAAARAECRRLSDLLSARERDVHATHADVERASAAASDLASRLTARSEEVVALRRELEAAREAAAAAQRSRNELAADAAAAVEGRMAALAAANGAGGHARAVSGRLEEVEARAAALQEALDKREQEVWCHCVLVRCFCAVGHSRLHARCRAGKPGSTSSIAVQAVAGWRDEAEVRAAAP